MSLTVKVLGRSRVQGGGHTTSGAAVNSKEFCWGELSGNYETNGVSLTATDVGLDSFDFLNLQGVTINNGTAPEHNAVIEVAYDEADEVFHVNTGDGSTEATNAQAYVINFFAAGDSVAAPDLT